MIRALLLTAAAAALAAGPALAQQQSPPRQGQAKPATAKPAAKPAATAKPAAPGGGQAARLAEFGDWGAYATPAGRNRVCYALSQPKERQPKTLQRDPGYVFVSFRPAENVRNEIAIMMGFPTKDGGPGEAAIGNAKFALVSKDRNAWVKNPAEEAKVVAEMARGQSLTVKVSSARGNQTTDRYSLAGFADALARVRKECP